MSQYFPKPFNRNRIEIENKLNDLHLNDLDTSEFNTLATTVFNARITQANLKTKTDFDAKLLSLNRKITQNKSKHLFVENELNALKSKIPDANGSSLVKKADYNTKVAAIDGKVSNLDGKIGKTISKIVESFILLPTGYILFDGGDGSLAYLIFQPVYKYFKFITGTNYISSWKSKALSDEIIKPTTTSDNSLTPLITYYDYDTRVKFNGSILRQPKFTYTH